MSDDRKARILGLARAQLKGCRRERRPLYLSNDQIQQHDRSSNMYVGYSEQEIASRLCVEAEAEVDCFLEEDARFYVSVAKELKLRAPRLPIL